MIIILLASAEKASLSHVASTLDKDNIQTFRAESGSMALSMISDKTFDLIIADEQLGDMSGLEFAEKAISTNPMINCAVVSSLSAKEYHEKSEGLGLLMQLPPDPGEEHAGDLLKHLKNILNLTGRTDI